MDIVERLRELASVIPDGAANPSDANTVKDAILEIANLRAELIRCGESLDKCHAQLMRANSPVVDCRNSYEGERFRPAECGGFQGFED